MPLLLIPSAAVRMTTGWACTVRNHMLGMGALTPHALCTRLTRQRE